MANKRMFSLDIIDTDAFLEMPVSTQALYFHLGMRADDDGFVSSPKKVAKITNCSNDDLRLLVTKGYLIPFQSGVVVITHWKSNNYVRKDRYTETRYIEEKNMLQLQGDVYTLKPSGIPSVNQVVDERLTQVRLGKDSIDNNIINNIICPEPLEAPDQNPAISLILNNKTMHNVYQKDIDQWTELYPAVDILQELRKMKGWLDANPTKRKTSRGIKRFINAWLSKEQDKGRNNGSSQSNVKTTKFSNFEQRDYNFDDLEKQLLDR